MSFIGYKYPFPAVTVPITTAAALFTIPNVLGARNIIILGTGERKVSDGTSVASLVTLSLNATPYIRFKTGQRLGITTGTFSGAAQACDNTAVPGRWGFIDSGIGSGVVGTVEYDGLIINGVVATQAVLVDFEVYVVADA